MRRKEKKKDYFKKFYTTGRFRYDLLISLSLAFSIIENTWAHWTRHGSTALNFLFNDRRADDVRQMILNRCEENVQQKCTRFIDGITSREFFNEILLWSKITETLLKLDFQNQLDTNSIPKFVSFESIYLQGSSAEVWVKERNVNSFFKSDLPESMLAISVWKGKKRKFENRCLPCHRRPSWPVDGRLWDEGAVVDASFLRALLDNRSVKQKDKNN